MVYFCTGSVSEDKLSDVDLEIYPIDTSSKDQEPEDKIEQTKALSSVSHS